MIALLCASTLLLTVVVVALSIMLFALARQIGVLHERIAPIGVQPTLAGLHNGQALPRIVGRTLRDEPFPLGGMNQTGRATLLMIIGADCPVCKRTLPLARAVAAERQLDFILVGEGDVGGLHSMVQNNDLGAPLVTSQELLLLLQVGRLPTLIALDPRGVIVARDTANTRRQIEALLAPLDNSSTSPAEIKEFHHVAI